jgi:RNA ligase (TIGR02306 family)
VSTLKVTVEKLIVEPHPNADLLELAQVGLYRAVVPKDVYQTGDYAIYIPEQAILPDALIEELGLTGKLAGKAKNRVKAVRLRGELSQGVVCLPAKLDGIDLPLAAATGLDWSEALGIEKWVPEIPAHMSGKVIPAPDLIRWVDIENLKRYPDIFTPGEPVVATEKIHGTCCLVTYHAPTDTLLVSSKGFGERSLSLEEDDTNLYWRAAQQFGLKDQLAGIASEYSASSVALFGEVYGAGIQDLAYGKVAGRNATLGFVAFDMAMITNQGKWWLDADHFREMMDVIPTAPVLYEGPFDLEKLTEAASGMTVLGDRAHIREGIVIRPKVEAHSDILGGRKIAKLVSDEYLLRKGGTEFE